MANSFLSTYLNDHAAGSVTAIELLANLAETYPDTEISTEALELKAEVIADRQELEAFMEKLKISRTVTRRAAAWLGEKLSQVKLRADDPKSGALRQLESIEAISLGVEGKRLLWRSLSTASETEPALRGPDYARLVQRAEDQRGRLETMRLPAARAALHVDD